MKRFLLFLLLCGFCDSVYADRDSDCRQQANKRIELYNKPDSYEINEKEKANALLALYSQCMREEDPKNPDGLATKVGNPSDSTVIYTQGGESSVQQGGIVKTVKGNGSGVPTIVIVQSPSPIYTSGENDNAAKSVVLSKQSANQSDANSMPVEGAEGDKNKNADKLSVVSANNQPPPPPQVPPNIIINNNIPPNP
ncbi:MAG: hypothetical protein WCL30_02770, partial [Pseudomonadota bacterium]